MKFFWTIGKIQLLADIYRELAKQDKKRKNEFEEKAKALTLLVGILKQVPENRRSMGSLAEFLTLVSEEVNPPKRWFSFFTKKEPIPLSLFTEQIKLFRDFKEQLDQIAAK